MTKQQVTAILGKPKTTSFNELGDKWMYEGWKGSLVGGDQVRTYVAFDTTGKVIRYEEQIYNPSPSEAMQTILILASLPAMLPCLIPMVLIA